MSESEVSREPGGAAKDAPGGPLGSLRSKNSWTLVALAVLLVFTMGAAYLTLFSSQPQFVAIRSAIAVVIGLVLIGLMWTETRRTVGLAVIGGVALTAFYVGLAIIDGPRGGDSVAIGVGWSLIYLLAPITAYMSYRQL